MSWVALIPLILAFLEKLPAIVEMLRDLFGKATPEGSPEGYDPQAGMAKLFTAAREQLWWWQWGKRARLAVAERVCVNRAPEFWRTMRTGDRGPAMTLAEYEELRAA